jgi:lipopolysaccharide/colanic/teichoic acid biosynthesis glycosyltransferase
MSVVGPRPERPEIDMEIKTTEVDWSKRWFIKPGLTGLAQINDATGHEPRAKLRYDIQYVREQSFIYDMKIVIRQIWMVILDIVNMMHN